MNRIFSFNLLKKEFISEMVHFYAAIYTITDMNEALNHLFMACCKSLQREFNARLQEDTMIVLT